MKTVCIYHSIDLDGWMSAAIVEHWWILKTKSIYDIENNSIDFVGCNYGQPIPDLSEYDQVIMVDISFPAETMKELRLKLKAKFIWIDHHISAIKDNAEAHKDFPLPNGIRDTKFAACELTWKFFFPNEQIPEIVRLLGMYDSFRHKNTDEEIKVLEFQYGARMLITNYNQAYDFLIANISHGDSVCESIHIDGAAIYRYLCTEAKQVYKNGFEINIGQNPNVKLIDITTIPDTKSETLKNAVGTFLPYKFLCFNKERFNPVNFGIDYHKDGYDGCACFHYANGMWNFSLYNDNGEVDCSVIAKQYGGGGHKGAAGFILNFDKLNTIIK